MTNHNTGKYQKPKDHESCDKFYKASVPGYKTQAMKTLKTPQNPAGPFRESGVLFILISTVVHAL